MSPSARPSFLDAFSRLPVWLQVFLTLWVAKVAVLFVTGAMFALMFVACLSPFVLLPIRAAIRSITG